MSTQPITLLSEQKQGSEGGASSYGWKWRLADGSIGWYITMAGGSSSYGNSYWLCNGELHYVRVDLMYHGTSENRYKIGPVASNIPSGDREILVDQVHAWEKELAAAAPEN